MRGYAIALLVLLLAGCSGDSTGTTAVVPADLDPVSKTAFSGTAGETLAEPLVVRVTGSDGAPMRGVAIAWAVASGGGQLGIASSQSDSLGLARANWTLGGAAGVQSVTASVGSLAAVSFSATVGAGSPARIVPVSGDSQSVEIGQALPNPFVARVTDSFGNPVAGAAVTWQDGGTRSATTDAQGLTTHGATTNTQSGVGGATLRAGSASYTFTFTKRPGPPVPLIDGTRWLLGVAGQTITDSVSARVVDRYFNGVPGVPVKFRVVRGGGSLSAAERTTDAQGYARVAWTLGPAGGSDHQVEARADGLGSSTFNAEAKLPGPDVTAPTWTSFQVVDPVIDVRSSSATIRVRLNTTDTQSPLLIGGGIVIRDPAGKEYYYSTMTGASASPSYMQFEFEYRVIIPAGSRSGTYIVYAIRVEDTAHNARTVFYDELVGKGYAPRIQVTGF